MGSQKIKTMKTLTLKNNIYDVSIFEVFNEISKYFIPRINILTWYRKKRAVRALKKLNLINSSINVLKFQTKKETDLMLSELVFFSHKLNSLQTKDETINSLIVENIKTYEDKIIELEIHSDCFSPDFVYSKKEETELLSKIKQADTNIANGNFTTLNTAKELEAYFENV